MVKMWTRNVCLSIYVLLCCVAVTAASLPTECCICDDNAADVSKRCSTPGVCSHNFHICFNYCQMKKTFVGGSTWATKRHCADEATCVNNWYHTVSTLGCIDNTRGEPGTGTTCYSCCTATSAFKPFDCRDEPNKNIVYFNITTIPTTAPVTSPTTTTTVTPLVTTTRTPNTGGGYCQVCRDLSCLGSDKVQCGSGEDYCQNTIITDASATVTSVKKQCATETECFYDSYMAMKDHPECLAAAVTSGNSNAKGVCHYCCKSNAADQSACNHISVPTPLYNGPEKTGSMCEIGRDGVYTTQQCHTTTPLCMNTLVFSKSYSTIKKTCEPDIICNTDWWKNTRDIPKCLTKNVASLPVEDPGLVCHYCCQSTGGTPCNADDIPADVHQFLTMDGGWSQWSTWQGCSSACAGDQVRVRSCDSPLPGQYGTTCSGQSFQQRKCDQTNCQGGSNIVG